MRVVRWRWALVPMVVAVAGCLPRGQPDLPPEFLRQFDDPGEPTFTTQAPPAGQTGQDVIAALRAQGPEPMFRGRAVPVFGVIDCQSNGDCSPLSWGSDPRGTRAVWVVLYPDCVDDAFVNVPGVALDIGWAVVDAVDGLAGGYASSGSWQCP